MNGDCILEIARWVFPIAIAYIAYRLGLRSQKFQALREYVAGVVKKEYPSLFAELKENSELLDDYLENPNVNFDFPQLEGLYNRGLEEFMKTHHTDLFQKTDFFRNHIITKFRELKTYELMEKASAICSECLARSLPKEVAQSNVSIAHDLCMSIGKFYIIPDLLNKRYDDIRDKVEACILGKISNIYHEKTKRRFVIRESQEQAKRTREMDPNEITKEVISEVESLIDNLIEKHTKLKKQIDEEVRRNLLPLLQKYISKPI